MGKYIAGPSVLRFPGRPAVLPGEWFEYAYDEVPHETLALASGAIALQPGETSLADQARAAQLAADEAAAIIAAAPAVEDAAVGVIEPAPDAAPAATEEHRSAPASRRRTAKEQKE